MIPFVSAVSREDREQILGGSKVKISPPVGVYSPKYEVIYGKVDKGQVKYDVAKVQARHKPDLATSADSALSLHQAPSIHTPTMLKNHSIETITEPVPTILQRHVPNVFFDRQTGRRGEMFALNASDDSNIHYENIFPQILSKNIKHSSNVSLEKMVVRKTEFDSAGAEMQPTFYDRKYTLIEKKVPVPILVG